uniref:Alkane hydroxylase MAH1-like n=1 Tax=Ananas comosus var. bracteatus TaxID=296719 RepID=A0A6V7QJK3_ANACO|nr:unnamed protein product [Ananas comosus var. bracteatus]
MASPQLLQQLLSFLRTHPELLVSVFCFLLLRRLSRGRGSGDHDCRLPTNWPVAGMIPGVLVNMERLHEWSTDLLRRTGCTFVFKGPWLNTVDVLITCDPANMRHVFTSNFPNYPKGAEFAKIFDVLGNGIFNADMESWSFQRKKAHLVMSGPKFRAFVEASTKEKLEKGLVPVLGHLADKGEVFNLQDVFLRLTFDTTYNFVFGVDPASLAVNFPTDPFAKAMDEVEEILFYRHVIPRAWLKLQKWLNIGDHRHMRAAQGTIDQCIAHIISARRESKNTTAAGAATDDILSAYLDSRDEFDGSDAAFYKFLRDSTLNFMVAGRDTTSSALTWFFWSLAQNPHVEKMILQELRSLAPRNPSFPTSAELRDMVYLHAALCESLRLFPPVPFEHKAPDGGDMGKDCLEFKPERWISSSGKLRYEPSYKFPAFNSGPRTCLGRDLAFTQMKAVVAAVVTNFRFEVAQGFVVKPRLSIILHMRNGLKVRVRKRDS